MESNLEALDLLAAGLDDASDKGHLPDPSLHIELVENTNLANTDSYILAIRARLIDLGYLGESTENRSKKSLDDRLKKAIKKFQKEARLKEDAWVGPKTWHALQQLVSFENEQDPAHWRKELIGDLSQPAIKRAVYLRLYALGFFEWDRKLNLRTNLSLKSNLTFRSALAAFLKTARTIGAMQKLPEPEISIDALRVLFRQDDLIHALNSSPGFVKNPQNRKFVEAIARIELWMLGFNVQVGNPGARLKRRQVHSQKESLTPLSLALVDFWNQLPKAARPGSESDRQTVTPDFFRQLIAFEAAGSSPEDFADEDIIKRISSFSTDEQASLKRRLTNIAGSIWDGVKRVFRWIKLFIKKIVSTASNLIKNIARFLAKRARSVFETVRKVFEIVYRGTVYFRKECLPGSDARRIAVYHDKDFDTAVFINCTAPPQTVRCLIDDNRRESVCFQAACLILADLTAILRRVVQTFIGGIAGWFLALLALTRLSTRIGDIMEQVMKVQAADFEIESSPFANAVS